MFCSDAVLSTESLICFFQINFELFLLFGRNWKNGTIWKIGRKFTFSFQYFFLLAFVSSLIRVWRRTGWVLFVWSVFKIVFGCGIRRGGDGVRHLMLLSFGWGDTHLGWINTWIFFSLKKSKMTFKQNWTLNFSTCKGSSLLTTILSGCHTPSCGQTLKSQTHTNRSSKEKQETSK